MATIPQNVNLSTRKSDLQGNTLDGNFFSAITMCNPASPRRAVQENPIHSPNFGSFFAENCIFLVCAEALAQQFELAASNSAQ